MKSENSKLSGYLLIAVFVVPLLIAIILYNLRDQLPAMDTVAHGELIHPAQPITLMQVILQDNESVNYDAFAGKWTYFIYSPEGCDLQCEAALFKVRQTKKATGRESNRVQSVLLTNSETVDGDILNRNQSIHVGNLQKLDVEGEPGKQLDKDCIYLVDPIGNLMMKYDTTASSRGMLKDIKKLLKISNIG